MTCSHGKTLGIQIIVAPTVLTIILISACKFTWRCKNKKPGLPKEGHVLHSQKTTLEQCKKVVENYWNPATISLIYNVTNSSCEFSPITFGLPRLPSEDKPDIKYCFLGKALFTFLNPKFLCYLSLIPFVILKQKFKSVM